MHKYIGNWTGPISFRILPAHGSRSMTKARQRSSGLKKTLKRGVSSGREGVLGRMGLLTKSEIIGKRAVVSAREMGAKTSVGPLSLLGEPRFLFVLLLIAPSGYLGLGSR